MMNKIRMNELLDHYGGLLTEKQQDICRYYFREDYSYQEIAEITGTSRAAVYDTVKRSTEEVAHYEEILKIDEMSRKRMSAYDQILAATNDETIIRAVSICKNTEIEGGNYE